MMPKWIEKIMQRSSKESISDILKSRGDLLCAITIALDALEEAKVIVDKGIVQLRVKTALRRIEAIGGDSGKSCFQANRIPHPTKIQR